MCMWCPSLIVWDLFFRFYIIAVILFLKRSKQLNLETIKHRTPPPRTLTVGSHSLRPNPLAVGLDRLPPGSLAVGYLSTSARANGRRRPPPHPTARDPGGSLSNHTARSPGGSERVRSQKKNQTGVRSWFYTIKGSKHEIWPPWVRLWRRNEGVAAWQKVLLQGSDMVNCGYWN